LNFSEASSQLENHVNCATSFKVVVADFHLIIQLLATKDESDLVNHDAFLLLKCLFDLEDGVVWVEVEALLSAC
jgi:hypothetical protein